MQGKLKKGIIIFLLLTFFFIEKVDAQIEKKPLSYKKLNKSLKGGITWDLFFWTEGYYYSYLEYTEDVNKFFSFEHDNISLKMKSLLRNNKDAFLLKATDSTLYIYYENQLIFEIDGFSLDCFDFNKPDGYKEMVRVYDENGMCFWNEELLDSFRADIIEIYRNYIQKKYIQAKHISIFPDEADDIRIDRPLIMLYQYEKSEGLSIHKICSCKYRMPQNLYTQSLSELAEKYCEKYNLSKIIFAARVMYQIDNVLD